jgi:hypothetical protein
MVNPVPSEVRATPRSSNTWLLVISWLWVGVPLIWGVLQTLRTSTALFH